MTSIFASPAGRRGRAVIALAAALALGAAAAPPAHAGPPTASDNESARQLLREGVKLRARGDIPGAVKKLEGAHALVHTPVTGLELGKTYLLLHKLVEARDVFREVVRMPEDRETDRTRDARAEADETANALATRIPAVVVKISGGPDPSRVTVMVDSEVVPAAALAAPRKVNPGKHTVIARIDDAPRARVEITLAEGETKEVKLDLPKDVPHPPPNMAGKAAPPRPFWGGQRIAGAVVGGVGLVGVGLGAAFGAQALSKNSASNAGGHCHDGNVCDSTGFALREDARSVGTLSTVMWIAGGVALAGGLTLFLTAPRAGSAALVAGPSGVFAQGTF